MWSLDNKTPPGPESVLALGGAALVGLIAAFVATGLSLRDAADVAVHPLAMGLLLTTLSLPFIRWATRGDTLLFRVALGGLVAKSVGMYLRFQLTGSGDNRAYHTAGTQISQHLGEAITGPGGLPGNYGDTGTDWLSYMVGWLYYFTGPNRLTAFVFFTFLGFAGTLLFYRAAIDAIPGLDRLRYALLLFYLPSMLFWPSTIGKEAWMIFCLGLAAFGISGVLDHRFTVRYLATLALGLGLAARVRPHIAALVLLALVAAMLWPTSQRANRGRRVVAIVVAFAVLSVVMGQVADYFGSSNGELAPILDFAQERTAEGGSEFSPLRITGPVNLLPGLVSVMFRPFLIEATNTFQLLGSLESLGLVVLAFLSWSRLRHTPRAFLTNAYVRFVVLYSLGFCVAFSAISNFGILARQRSQLWPILMVLLALAVGGGGGTNTTDSGPADASIRDERERQPDARPTSS